MPNNRPEAGLLRSDTITDSPPLYFSLHCQNMLSLRIAFPPYAFPVVAFTMHEYVRIAFLFWEGYDTRYVHRLGT